ncbi:hypothetical protein NPIL_596501, partial [Nephila pilipes]
AHRLALPLPQNQAHRLVLLLPQNQVHRLVLLLQNQINLLAQLRPQNQ